MVAAWEDITVDAGSTFEQIIELTDEDGDPRDLSTWTGLMTIRDDWESATALAEGDVVCTSAGLVTVTIPASETALMTWRAGVYDLTIASGARVEPVVKGRAVLKQSATR